MKKQTIIILSIVALILISGIICGFSLLNKKVRNNESVSLYIYPSESYEKVLEKLEKNGVIEKNERAFSIFSKGLVTVKYVISLDVSTFNFLLLELLLILLNPC